MDVLLVNKQLHNEEMDVFSHQNAVTFTAFPSEMLDFMQHALMHALSKMQSVRFLAPSLQVQGCTAHGGHVNVHLDKEIQKKNALWADFLNILKSMKLKELTAEERVERMSGGPMARDTTCLR